MAQMPSLSDTFGLKLTIEMINNENISSAHTTTHRQRKINYLRFDLH